MQLEHQAKETLQRPTDNATGTPSNAKTRLDDWFSANITGTNLSKVADGKFCNDRNIASGYSWSSQPSSTFYYAGYERLYTNKTPTLDCLSEDTYTLKVGLITADEVVYAGGVYAINNNKYYLYNTQYYWTMSPHSVDGTPFDYAFVVYPNGRLSSTYMHNTSIGLIPVINLVSDVIFEAGGDGTLDNPYVVEVSE